MLTASSSAALDLLAPQQHACRYDGSMHADMLLGLALMLLLPASSGPYLALTLALTETPTLVLTPHTWHSRWSSPSRAANSSRRACSAACLCCCSAACLCSARRCVSRLMSRLGGAWPGSPGGAACTKLGSNNSVLLPLYQALTRLEPQTTASMIGPTLSLSLSLSLRTIQRRQCT